MHNIRRDAQLWPADMYRIHVSNRVRRDFLGFLKGCQYLISGYKIYLIILDLKLLDDCYYLYKFNKNFTVNKTLSTPRLSVA